MTNIEESKFISSSLIRIGRIQFFFYRTIMYSPNMLYFTIENQNDSRN